MKDGLNIGLDGAKYWHKMNKLHREDGPAIEDSDGNKEWWVNGVLHRIDGPAIIYSEGYKEWHFRGLKIDCSTQEEFERLIKLKAFW